MSTSQKPSPVVTFLRKHRWLLLCWLGSFALPYLLLSLFALLYREPPLNLRIRLDRPGRLEQPLTVEAVDSYALEVKLDAVAQPTDENATKLAVLAAGGTRIPLRWALKQSAPATAVIAQGQGDVSTQRECSKLRCELLLHRGELAPGSYLLELELPEAVPAVAGLDTQLSLRSPNGGLGWLARLTMQAYTHAPLLALVMTLIVVGRVIAAVLSRVKAQRKQAEDAAP